MSALSEFTGVGAIPAGPMGGLKAGLRKKVIKKRIVDAFLEVASSSLQEEIPSTDLAQEPATDTPPTPAVPAPQPDPVPVPPAPTVAPAASAAPVTTSTGESVKALMLSREVVEALAAGHSVNVRGVLLEPAFKASVAAPKPIPEDMAARAQSMVASVLESVPSTPGAVTFAAVDMNAPQPAPAAPSDGRAVMSAFRRFGG